MTRVDFQRSDITAAAERRGFLVRAMSEMSCIAHGIGCRFLLLAVWGMVTLGGMNTSGLKGGFVSSGPYRFNRNPQYLGDIILFVGVSIIANSLLLWITHALLILVFAIAPLTEERWLEDQYGQSYREYRRDIPRFWFRWRGRMADDAKRRDGKT